jgi:hypothetical protein
LHGEGYLKRPVGHHLGAWISTLEDSVRGDVSGLDGHVEVETFLDTDEVVAEFTRALEEVWGYPVRIVENAEFYDNHPDGLNPERNLMR